MAKGGKRTKLKSVIKKLNSFSKPRCTASFVSSDEENEFTSTISETEHHLYPVYVGKARRCYLITSQVIANPLFEEIVERSDETGEMIIGCEVVLFENLLWMIENVTVSQLESLAEFYTGGLEINSSFCSSQNNVPITPEILPIKKILARQLIRSSSIQNVPDDRVAE